MSNILKYENIKMQLANVTTDYNKRQRINYRTVNLLILNKLIKKWQLKHNSQMLTIIIKEEYLLLLSESPFTHANEVFSEKS